MENLRTDDRAWGSLLQLRISGLFLDHRQLWHLRTTVLRGARDQFGFQGGATARCKARDRPVYVELRCAS